MSEKDRIFWREIAVSTLTIVSLSMMYIFMFGCVYYVVIDGSAKFFLFKGLDVPTIDKYIFAIKTVMAIGFIKYYVKVVRFAYHATVEENSKQSAKRRKEFFKKALTNACEIYGREEVQKMYADIIEDFL